MTSSVEVGGGEIPLTLDDEGPSSVAVLAHGAGGHMEQKTVLMLAEILRSCGLRVARFNFLYRAQGKGMPDRMPVLEETYRAVVRKVAEETRCKRLILSGHSMGGRTASMIEAKESVGDGLILFGYPLHPAGQPEKLRIEHLASIHVPTLQLNGTEDPLCTQELMDSLAPRSPNWTLHWLQGADHSYAVKRSSGKTPAEVREEMRSVIAEWLKDSIPA